MPSLRAILLLAAALVRFGNSTCLAAVFDHTVPPKKTDEFTLAVFRLTIPDDPGPLRGIIVESGGSNLLKEPEWQEFARKYKLALLTYTVAGDTRSLKGGIAFCEGPACEPTFSQALQALAATSKHPEITTAPLLVFGACGSGQAGFFPWKKNTSPRLPPRTIAFAGTSWREMTPDTAKEQVPAHARDIPGLLIIPLNTDAKWTAIAKGIFTSNRKRGALWSLAAAESKDAKPDALLRAFFEGALAQRLPAPAKSTSAPVQLTPVDVRKEWLGNLQTKEILPSISYSKPRGEAAWFPDEATGKAWVDFMNSK
jgi:hypothetical protein